MSTKPADLVDRIYDGLLNNPFNTVGALLILIIALPLIKSALREKPVPPPAPPLPERPVPIEVESAWFVQNVTRMQMDIESIDERLKLLSSQIAGVAQLIKRQGKIAAAASAKAAARAAGKDKPPT